ncbi:MAG: hydrogenase iron-sulfur subunit [bacterium]
MEGDVERMKITVFCCYNSLYGGAATPKAGVAGLHKIEVPCSSRVDPIHILKAFENGADGVILIACPEDLCKTRKGSRLAAKRIAYTKQLLEEAGLNPERLMMFQPDVPSAPSLERIADEARAVLEKMPALTP